MSQKQKFGLTLFIILVSYFLILMDNSVVFTSSMQIGKDLQMDESTLSWVSNAYTITFGGFLLLMGRLGDFVGRKKMFITGLIIFLFSSLMIGLSQSSTAIISFRAIQGVGSAIIAPTSLVLLMDNYSGESRTRAIAYYGATAGIGASVGLLLGGGLTTLLSWRAGFLINVPFSILLVFLAIIKIQSSTVQKTKIDYLGAILSVLISTSFVYAVTKSNLFLIIFSLLLLTVFVFIEKAKDYALINFELFKHPGRSGAYIGRFIFMMAMLVYWFIIPQIMQEMYHFTALQAAMGFLPLTIANFISALYLPRLTSRMENDRVLVLGQTILISGILLSTLISPRAGYVVTIGLPMLLVGWGQGWLLAPLTSAAVQGVSPELAGGASGLTNTMHQLGGPVGLSIVDKCKIIGGSSKELSLFDFRKMTKRKRTFKIEFA